MNVETGIRTRYATAADARDRPAAADTLTGGHAVAGLSLVAVGVAFITVTMLAATIAPAYDYNAAAISDLGVIEETAGIFNGLLLLVGALNLVAGVLLYRVHGRRRVLTVYLAAGVGAIGAGLVPLDRGELHALFALFGFVFFNLEAVATAPLLQGPLRAISYLAGLIGLVYVAVMVVGDSGNPAIFGAIGHGGSERMIVYPAMLWAVACGGYLAAGGKLHGAKR
jgi:hypothetical membrane protein